MSFFDAVLVVSFGGPGGLADIRPFLANVLRGRRVSPDRVEEVARHYERFGGVSPLTRLTFAQAEGLAGRLRRDGPPLPVYVGMRNWNPLLADTLAEMSKAGVRRAVGVIAAAFQGESSCAQYRQNVADARRTLRDRGLADVEVSFVPGWSDHPGFIAANAASARAALERLDPALRDDAKLVFTAHSIPRAMADRCRYEAQFETAARAVAEALGRSECTLAYQSRSGRPEDPWLEPDVNDVARTEASRGTRAIVVIPIGFVCDHVEVLYDLDTELRATCTGCGIAFERAGALNDSAPFVEMLADVVRTHARRRHLPVS